MRSYFRKSYSNGNLGLTYTLPPEFAWHLSRASVIQVIPQKDHASLGFEYSPRVHAPSCYTLRPQSPYIGGTLRPKYSLFRYMDPEGLKGVLASWDDASTPQM